MPIQSEYKIIANDRIGLNTMLMRLEGPTDCFTVPGQFVDIAIPGLELRRPISVCDYGDNRLTIVYDIVGKGTAAMAAMHEGETLDILAGLGRGFDPDKAGDRPLLVGGGVGCPPIYSLAKTLIARGVTPQVVVGFNSKERIIMADMFADLGCPVSVATVDGSEGVRGFVTDAIDALGGSHSFFYACGPTPMLRALCSRLAIPGQLSLEARMGCGFGACMCCSLETTRGSKRICKEGPVFDKEELIWK